MNEIKIGTIITTQDGPSVNKFSFIVENQTQAINRGEFISVETSEGTTIATISNIYKTNKYFESAGAVKEYNKASELYNSFPIKEWEYTIAEAKTLGIYGKDNLLNRSSFPLSPGSIVTTVNSELLNKFLGLDQNRGLHLGTVQQHNLSAKLNLTRLIQKHLAILAISGSGKSYCTAVLLEELASRDTKNGRISVIVIDNHGEYSDLDKDSAFQNKIITIDAKDIKIGTANISEKMFASLLPSMSSVQVRELGKVIKKTRAKSKSYDLKELIQEIKNNDDISKATREALAGWLSELEFMGLFSTSDWPNLQNFMKQGNIVVLNLKEILSLKKKQLIVNYVSRMLFNLRKQGLIPPYLQIIEEAHNFCPEGRAAEHAISRGIIELLAREGRKFYANICLISQRPIQLSTTALSQCNSQIIFKITNPYDLDHIGKSSEAISSHTLDIVSSLKVGEALIIGEAVNYPVFVKIRKRKSSETHGTKLEDYAILYEKLAKENGLADASEFL